jgi:hypothetical protein
MEWIQQAQQSRVKNVAAPTAILPMTKDILVVVKNVGESGPGETKNVAMAALLNVLLNTKLVILKNTERII